VGASPSVMKYDRISSDEKETFRLILSLLALEWTSSELELADFKLEQRLLPELLMLEQQDEDDCREGRRRSSIGNNVDGEGASPASPLSSDCAGDEANSVSRDSE